MSQRNTSKIKKNTKKIFRTQEELYDFAEHERWMNIYLTLKISLKVNFNFCNEIISFLNINQLIW